MLRFLSCALLLLTLAGCGARPGPAVLDPVPGASACARQVTLCVATAREPDPEHGGSFSARRATALNFARYTVAIPPNHKPANIEWPGPGPADPGTNFTTVEHAALDREGFLEQLAQGPDSLGAPASGPVRVAVFVHGYNTSFPEGLFRLAQLAADNPSPARPVLFSWPSDGTFSGYVADKDAATYSRDHLARLLTLLADDPRIEGIDLGAHSMGCWLTMEVLRQLRLNGQERVLRRLGSVVLAAPDIDLDVFRAQVEVLGPLDPPLTVLASPDDRALRLSNRLGGDRDRAGSLDVRDPQIQALAEAGGLQLIDISGMSATDSLNHDRFVGAVASLQKVLTPKPSQNPLRKAGAFVLDAAALVLEVPARISRVAAEVVK